MEVLHGLARANDSNPEDPAKGSELQRHLLSVDNLTPLDLTISMITRLVTIRVFIMQHPSQIPRNYLGRTPKSGSMGSRRPARPTPGCESDGQVPHCSPASARAARPTQFHTGQGETQLGGVRPSWAPGLLAGPLTLLQLGAAAKTGLDHDAATSTSISLGSRG